MTKFAFSIFLLFAPFQLLAQAFAPNPDWRFENFNSQNHFINREISDLALDKYGYVWTCGRGVQRFDGYKTSEFNSFNQSKDALRSNYTDLIGDHNGRIWVNSGGLCYYDDASGKFIYVEADAKHHITDVNATLIQNNNLWFVSNHGLGKIDVQSLKISFTSLSDVVNPLSTFLLDDNTLLVSSREKVYIYNIKTNTYTANTLIYRGALLKIFAANKNNTGIFIGTNRGLFKFKNLHEVAPDGIDVGDIEIDDLTFLPQDKNRQYLFIATGGQGIMVYNTALKKVEFTYTHDDNNPNSLPSNLVSKFFNDKKGRVWVATATGISMLDIGNQQWKIRFLNKSNASDVNINKIARDKYDSTRVWMSSTYKGMVCLNWHTKKIEKIFDADDEVRQIYDFAQLSKDNWLLVTQKKIIEWNPQKGVLSKKTLPVPDSSLLQYNIRRIIIADKNTCYITTNKGLFKYNVRGHRVSIAAAYQASQQGANELQYNLVNGFNDNGILWIASKNGLFSFNTQTLETKVYRGPGTIADYYFFDITPAINNQIICAAGDGLTIFDKSKKSFTVINTIANLYKPNCGSVISTNSVVWINADAGILNYNLSTHSSARADNETASMQSFPGSPFSIIDSDIVFGFRNGYAYFSPNEKNTSVPSDPIIESVFANNKPVLPYYPSENKTRKIVFGPSYNSINIAFTAFSYTNPNQIKFRYRLKGADQNWQYTGDQRNANYAQLPPGNYTFYVQSGNNNGVWNNSLASLNFIITPPYWATWWFRTLVIGAIILVLYTMYRYRIKHLLAIERIRERIASDFHDDIGSALSSISIFSEVADKQLQQGLPHELTREIIGHISFHSRALLDAMDDIVWTVNPKNDHFNDLAIRMREFAIPLLEAKNIAFDIHIQEDILNARIKMEARKNIFLIFKECINNILKHSECSSMVVSVKKLNNQLELIISDDGKGFAMYGPNTRNGLKNMQKRADEIKGILELTSQPGNGTKVSSTCYLISYERMMEQVVKPGYIYNKLNEQFEYPGFCI